MAAIGIAETAYLIRERVSHHEVVCPIGGGCKVVLDSKYNKLFGVHNDVLGLLFYLATSAIAALLVIGTGPTALLNQLTVYATGFALLMSIRFFYLQWRVIKHWCFWCLLSSATIVVMSIILLTNNFVLTI